MFDPNHPKRKTPLKSAHSGSLLAAQSGNRSKETSPKGEQRSLLGFAPERKKTEQRSSESQVQQTAPRPALQQPMQAQQTHTQQNQQYNQNDGDEWSPLIDPRIVFRAILSSKLLIAACGLIGLGLSIMVALSTPKMYYSNVELLVDPRELIISDRELTPTGLPYDASLALVENQTQIIMSRRVMEQVVANLNLGQDAEFNGEGTGTPSPLTMLKELLSGSDAEANLQGEERAIQAIYRSVHVGRTPKSFIVLVGVNTENAEKSARIANEIARVYLILQQELRSETADRTGSALSQRLADLRSSVEQAERDVEMFKNENDIIDVSGRRISEEEILRVSAQLTEARGRIINLKSRAETTRSSSANDVISGSLPEDAGSALLSDLRKTYASKRQERDSTAERLGPRHPTLISLGAELNAINREIASELRRVSQSIQVDLQRAVQGEQELAGELARLKVQQGNNSNELIQLREMEREANAARAVYESFLNRARETREQGDINTANTTIISKAVPALKPTGTSRKIIAIGGLLAGLMAGFGLAILKGVWQSLMRETTPNAQARSNTTQHSFAPSLPDEPVPHAASLASHPDPLPPSGPPQGTGTSQPIPHETQTNNTDDHNKMGPYFYPAPQPQLQPQSQSQHPSHAYAQPYAGVPAQPVMQQPYYQPHMQQPYYAAPIAQPHYYQPPVAPQPQAPVQHFFHYVQQAMQPQMQPHMHAPVHAATPAQMQQPQPVEQPQSQPAPQTAQHGSDNSQTIRDRMNALRDGMAIFAQNRDKLERLG